MKIILLGASGRIGSATLNALYSHPEVTSVVALTRRPLSPTHGKVHNIIHKDFTSWPESLLKDELNGAGACIWTMGIRPSLVKSYDEAHAIDVDAPVSAAKAFAKHLGPSASDKERYYHRISSAMAESGGGKKAVLRRDVFANCIEKRCKRS